MAARIDAVFAFPKATVRVLTSQKGGMFSPLDTKAKEISSSQTPEQVKQIVGQVGLPAAKLTMLAALVKIEVAKVSTQNTGRSCASTDIEDMSKTTGCSSCKNQCVTGSDLTLT
jgi:hypothetical protein